MHIPKTSGMALAAALRTAIKAECEISGFDRVLFGSFTNFKSFAPETLAHLYLEPADLPQDGDFIAGHFAFSTLRQRYRSSNHITILREPTLRLLSNWLYGRTLPDDLLVQFGAWADEVRRVREPLKDWLSCKRSACATDNLTTRMLLWPHPLIPEGDFIDSCHYDFLLDEAINALREFSFADIIENPDMQNNLEMWLGQSLVHDVINETARIPPPLQTPLHDELTPETLDLIERRTRIDLGLWTWLATERTASDPGTLRWRTVISNAARHAALSVPVQAP